MAGWFHKFIYGDDTAVELAQRHVPLAEKHVIRTLCAAGDTALEYRLDDAAAVAEAERIFAEAIHVRKATAYGIAEKGAPAEMLKKFDKTMEEIIIVPQMAGG